MDDTTVQAIASMAETITSIGILLVWVYAERRDNKALWRIIEALVALRLEKIEHDTDDKI